MAFGMQQPILPNHIGAQIAQYHHLLVRDLLPYLAVVRFVVDANSYYFCVLSIKIGFPLRELAQLFHAEGSPVPAIKIQHDFVATLGGQIEILARSTFNVKSGAAC